MLLKKMRVIMKERVLYNTTFRLDDKIHSYHYSVTIRNPLKALIDHMTSGPSLILCLARDNAVEAWRELIGPKVGTFFDIQVKTGSKILTDFH